MAKVQTFTIHTGMGKSRDWGKLGITKEQCEILNDIGYGSNKNYGSDAEGFKNFLNSIDPNIQYDVICTRSDNGDFSAQYKVTKIILSTNDNDSDTITVEGTAEEIISLLQTRKGESLKVTISKVEKNKEAVKLEEQRKLDEEKKKKDAELIARKAELEKEIKEINKQL